jgi:UPF0716 protein FxsA
LPTYEILSGASIAIAALLLITPGFFTDLIGFLILIPFTRNIILKIALKSKSKNNHNDDIVDVEVIDKKDEL